MNNRFNLSHESGLTNEQNKKKEMPELGLSRQFNGRFVHLQKLFVSADFFFYYRKQDLCGIIAQNKSQLRSSCCPREYDAVERWQQHAR